MTGLPSDLGELTYCLSIHPSDTWADVRSALVGPVRRVKQRFSPQEPFAIGLRLSAQAVHSLSADSTRTDLKEILQREGYRPLTFNGFPFGAFHGTQVKERVYQPDWRSRQRLDYTRQLATLAAALAPTEATVSLSTVPGTFKPLGVGAESEMADRLLEAVAHCVALCESTGRTIALALEPEPFCFLATTREAVEFFTRYLLDDRAVRRLARLTGTSTGVAAAALPRHLGICYDVCHAAVEFEEPEPSIAALRDAGIPIHKLQLSAALRITAVDHEARRALAAFDEPTYLHQVVARREGRLWRCADLPEAIARGSSSDGEEWRVHFHVPIFVEAFDRFDTTQDFLRQVLALHRAQPISTHLEVETYTWDVLPEALRGEPVHEAIVRELRWVTDQLSCGNR